MLWFFFPSTACKMCCSRCKSSCKYHMAEEQQASGGWWKRYTNCVVLNCAVGMRWFSHSFSLLECSNGLFVSCSGISVHTSVQVDPVTGLSTTSSVLEYSAKKEDTDAQFSCSTLQPMGPELVSQPVTFTITCELPNPANAFIGKIWVYKHLTKDELLLEYFCLTWKRKIVDFLFTITLSYIFHCRRRQFLSVCCQQVVCSHFSMISNVMLSHAKVCF